MPDRQQQIDDAISAADGSNQERDTPNLTLAEALAKNPHDKAKSPAAWKFWRRRATDKYNKAKAELEELKKALEVREAELLTSARITVRGEVHSGTIIRMGSVERQLHDSYEAVRFHMDKEKGSIEFTVLSPND